MRRRTTVPRPVTTRRRTVKLIEFGFDHPSMAWLRAHPDVLQTTPFDGIVLDLQHTDQATSFNWEVWQGRLILVEDYLQAIVDALLTPFPPTMENFLRLNVTPGTVDWFDDQSFGQVCTNAALLATIAARLGFVGLYMDIEAYGAPLWDFRAQPHSPERSLAAYHTQVTQRGAAFMRALTTASPTLTVLLSFGLSWAQVQDPTDGAYSLLQGFLRGMLSAATPGMIYDGGEQAYAFTTAQQFATVVKAVRRVGVPNYRVSFGVYDVAHPQLEDWGEAIRLAMQATDRYVWIYSERLQFWQEPVSQEALDLLSRLKYR